MSSHCTFTHSISRQPAAVFGLKMKKGWFIFSVQAPSVQIKTKTVLLTSSINKMGGNQHIQKRTIGETVQGVDLKNIDCAPFQVGQKVEDGREQSVTLSICRSALNDTSLSYLHKTKDLQSSCQWLLFHAFFHVQPFLFMPLQC